MLPLILPQTKPPSRSVPPWTKLAVSVAGLLILYWLARDEDDLPKLGNPQTEEWYHISPYRFTVFRQHENKGWKATDAGFHFGSRVTALKRAEQVNQGGALYLYRVRLEASRPLHLSENRLGAWSVSDILRSIFNQLEAGDTIPGVTEQMFEEWNEDIWTVGNENAKEHLGNNVQQDVSQLKKWLKKIGYDSITYENQYEGGGKSIIVFEPSQIKILDVEQV